MKRTKTLLILSIAFVVLVGVIVAEVLITRHVDSINTVDKVVLSFNEEDLTNLSWKTEDGELDFTKGEAWTLDGDENFPVDQEYMSKFLSDFSEVHASFEITDVDDYSQYGLDDPVCTMIFKTADAENVLTMGTFSTMDSKRYISINSGDVYLIDEDLFEKVSVDKDAFLDNIDIPDIETLTKFEISGSSNLSFVYDADGDYTYTDSYCYYMTSDGGYKEISTSLAQKFINYICNVDLSEYASYTASSDDLSIYGLSEPEFTVIVTGKNGDDEEVSISMQFGETEKADITIDEGKELTDADLINAYMRAEGSEIVYVFNAENYIALREANYNSLRPAEILSLDWDLPTSMEATIDGETSIIEFTRNEDETVTCTIGEKEIEFDAIKAAISALSMTEFNEESPEKKEELSITVNQDKTGYEKMSLTFYQYDGENCLVTRNGETLGLISRSLMVSLREAINAVTLG